MKKKVWEFRILDNPNQAIGGENDQFYTTDTEAFLVFDLVDENFNPIQAMLTLVNTSDKSVVNETVTVIDGKTTWEMREEVIEHAGNWQAQLVYMQVKNGVEEKYTSQVVSFSVTGHLLDQRTPALVAVENWTKFVNDAEELFAEWVALEETLESNENERIANEQARQENYNELVDTGIMQENINQKLAEAEQEYAPRLTDLEQNDADLTAQLAQTTYDVSELQAYVGYTDHDIVGIEADLQNRRVTRIAGAVNRTPGQSFDNIRAFGGRRRCTVADDGTVLGYYGESGYDETGETGQVMVEQPKFYYKVVPLKLDKIEDGKGFHMRKARYYVSDSPKEGFKIHPAFVDENGKIRPYIYLSAFEGSIFDVSSEIYLKNDEQLANYAEDMMASIPGSKPASGISQRLTRANARKLAENRGTGWIQAYSASSSLTQMLFAIEYASFNTQEALAHGVLVKPSGVGNESEITGATTSLGNKSGFVEQNGFEVPTYRGEENVYGNIYKWVDGLNYQGDEGRRELYVATHGFFDSTDAKPHEDIGFTLPGANGYVSAFGYGNENMDWLFFASELGGNSSVPVGDQNYSSANGWRVTRLGGYWASSADVGGFAWDLNGSSGDSYRYVGCRLVYAPKGGN